MEFRHANTYRLPRGKRWNPPWQGTNLFVHPLPPDYRSAREIKAVLRRSRGRRYDFAFPEVETPITWTPSYFNYRKHIGLLAKRGRRFDFSSSSLSVPDFIESRRNIRVYRRRGKIFDVFEPITWVPSYSSVERNKVLPRRGKRYDFVSPTQEIVPSIWSPTTVSRRVKTAILAKRGHHYFVVPEAVIIPPEEVTDLIRWRIGEYGFYPLGKRGKKIH